MGNISSSTSENSRSRGSSFRNSSNNPQSSSSQNPSSRRLFQHFGPLAMTTSEQANTPQPPPKEVVFPEKVLTEGGGQNITFGILYPEVPDYDLDVVSAAILDKKLAPFYAPIEDDDDDKLVNNAADKDENIGEKLNEASAKTTGTNVDGESNETETSPQKDPIIDTMECPICFMVIPLYLTLIIPLLAIPKQFQLYQMLRSADLHRMLCSN